MIRVYSNILFLALTCVFVNGCVPQDDIQRYVEISNRPKPPVQICNLPPRKPSSKTAAVKDTDILNVDVDQISLQEQSLKAWGEIKPIWQPTALAAMSFGTFVSDNVIVTLTSLPGEAGGVEANVLRWLQQLSHLKLFDTQKNDFIQSLRKVEGKPSITTTIADYTQLSEDEDSDSMIAAIIFDGQKSIFIKMKGPLKELRSFRDVFIGKVQYIIQGEEL